MLSGGKRSWGLSQFSLRSKRKWACPPRLAREIWWAVPTHPCKRVNLLRFKDLCYHSFFRVKETFGRRSDKDVAG